MAGEPLLLGIDGGGTRCRARLYTMDGERLGEGLSGPANIRLGLDACWASILTATDLALAEAGLDADVLADTHAGLGLAGIVGADDIEFVLTTPPTFASIAVNSDAHTACLGAFAGKDGAILIVGTGSIGYALVGGTPHSVGGWGFEVSDGGSGAAIGREAVKAAVRAFDGLGPASDFTRQVLERLGPPARIVEWVGSARPSNYGNFAPDTLEFARKGDPVAASIVQQAAELLGAHIRQLRALGAPRVCMMGGLTGSIEPWLAPWARALLGQPVGDAMDGAILMARQSAEAARAAAE